MAVLALALAATLTQQSPRGPVNDDDLATTARRPLTAQHCPMPTGPDDIVVCTRDEPDRYRMGPLPPQPARREAPAARLRLPGGSEVHAEAIQHAAGTASATAAMVTLRIPLGGKKKNPADPQK